MKILFLIIFISVTHCNAAKLKFLVCDYGKPLDEQHYSIPLFEEEWGVLTSVKVYTKDLTYTVSVTLDSHHDLPVENIDYQLYPSFRIPAPIDRSFQIAIEILDLDLGPDDDINSPSNGGADQYDETKTENIDFFDYYSEEHEIVDFIRKNNADLPELSRYSNAVYYFNSRETVSENFNTEYSGKIYIEYEYNPGNTQISLIDTDNFEQPEPTEILGGITISSFQVDPVKAIAKIGGLNSENTKRVVLQTSVDLKIWNSVFEFNLSGNDQLLFFTRDYFSNSTAFFRALEVAPQL
jgi:hypothetical protein